MQLLEVFEGASLQVNQSVEPQQARVVHLEVFEVQAHNTVVLEDQ